MRIRRQGPSLAVDTPAKLNLFLEVLGRRADGYHDLETVMVSVGLYDSLRFTSSAGGALTLSVRESLPPISGVPRPRLISGPGNLVLKAAQMLRRDCRCEAGARIELIKRIPWESGLGGGSSDAAATLVGLNRLWGLSLGQNKLHELAATLGSDVNFFLDSCPVAVCRGRGERIEPRPLRRLLHFTIVHPQAGLSTGKVFSRWTPGERPPRSGDVTDWLAGGPSCHADFGVYNALEKPAIEWHDGLARLLADLRRESGMPVALTGSGSACFAICRTARQARTLAAMFATRGGCRTWSVGSRT